MNKKQLIIIPFQTKHLGMMDIREFEVANVCSIKDWESRLQTLVNNGDVLTAIYNGEVLGIGGVHDMYEGVCEVWWLPSKVIPKYALVFARGIKRYLEMMWDMGHYHIIQVTALNNEMHNRFFSWLGFDLETPNGMKYFTINKNNFNMWSRTK